MNDPHVARLIYRIEHSHEYSFEKAAPLDEPGPGFRVRIDQGQAMVEMSDHFATAEEAQAFVRPFLRAWEVNAGLERDPGVLRFVYQCAEIIDLKPTPGTVSISGTAVSVSAGFAVAQMALGRYPAPAAGFVVPPSVSAMYDSFARYKSERRGLAVTAFICLSLLQESTWAGKNKRQAAADKYGIERCVLDVLGTLSDEKGGPLHARKAKGLGTDYTTREITWLEAVIKAMIRRAGEVTHNPAAARQTISLKSLPKLP